MKKLISFLLALVMCLSLAACGGGKDSGSSSGGSSGSTASTPSTPDPAPEPEPEPEEEPGGADRYYFEQYPGIMSILDVEDIYGAPSLDSLSDTVWAFAGGAADGETLDEEGADAILEMYGGTLQVEFVDTENVNLVQGGGAMPGAYMFLDDGATMALAFELEGTTYEYAAVFTDSSDGEDLVMVLVALEEPGTAFFMALDM